MTNKLTPHLDNKIINKVQRKKIKYICEKPLN